MHKQGGYKVEDLNAKPYQDLILQTANVFDTAIGDNVISEDLRRALQSDAFHFGTIKVHAELFDASLYLLDENGHVKPISQLRHQFDQLNILYNEQYLDAEYQFAINSALSADQWSRIGEDNEVQYRTAGDEHVRKQHVELNRITLPKSSPFWLKWWPPNGWGCRCRAIEVLKGKYALSDENDAVAKGEAATTQIGKDGNNRMAIFQFNPGLSGKLMPPEHPYNKVKDADKAADVTGTNNTVRLNEMIKGDLPTNNEIKNILQSYSEKFPEDFRNGLDEVKFMKSSSYMMQHSMSYRASTGEWVGGSKISLSTFEFASIKFNPAEELRNGLKAIRNNIPLTFNQEYAFESLWHEILHAKTLSKPQKLTKVGVQNMETVNQFVARNTYHRFIERLGGKAHHQTEILENGYGYASWIRNFRRQLSNLNITDKEALEYFEPHLMNDYGTLGRKAVEFFKSKS